MRVWRSADLCKNTRTGDNTRLDLTLMPLNTYTLHTTNALCKGSFVHLDLQQPPVKSLARLNRMSAHSVSLLKFTTVSPPPRPQVNKHRQEILQIKS